MANRRVVVPDVLGEVGWMRRYCEWRVCQTKMPTQGERQAKASICAGKHIGYDLLRRVERSVEYGEVMARLVSDEIELARASLRSNTQVLIQGHLDMANEALEAKDYDSYHKYSQPMVDRVWPKQEETVRATQINVTLGSGFAQKQLQDGLQDRTEVVICEAEVVKP